MRSRSGKYGGDKSWLLFKEADDFARLGPEALITEDRPQSVITGRSLDEIAAAGAIACGIRTDRSPPM